MKINLRHKYLSRSRYNRYLYATHNHKEKAKRLYNANIRLAQAFHPLLTQFEVILRNSLSNILAAHFIDPDWIINQKNGFMSNPSLGQSRYYLKECIIKSERKFNRRNTTITNGKLLADQTFGFWIALFLPHHYSLLNGKPIQIFPHKPTNENRASIHAKLEKIKDFRNRVNHCEPICFNGQHIDCTEARDIKQILYHLIKWIDPELVPFFTAIDNINNKTNQIHNI